MADAEKAGRPNQKRRTRKDLLDAAFRLMKEGGRKPTLEEVAEEALVSRATAYRYFPSTEALLNEAALDVAFPSAKQLFGNEDSADPLVRMEQVEEAVQEMVAANEAPLRMMLASALEQGLKGPADLPARQNRRMPLIEAALEPARDSFDAVSLDRLPKALALLIGTEQMLVFKDVLQLPEKEARDVRRWAIRALIEAARKL